MKIGPLTYARGRWTAVVLGMWLAVVVAVMLAGPLVLEVRVVSWRDARWTPIWEALPALYAASIGAGVAPRLASWEAIAAERLRPYAIATAVIAICLPASVPWIAHFSLPADARWLDIVTNVVIIAALSLIAVSTLGRLRGTACALAIYLLIVPLQQAYPAIAPYLILSGSAGDVRPRVVECVLLASIAVGVWSARAGACGGVARIGPARRRHRPVEGAGGNPLKP